jgi:hypothetical protein
LRGQSLVAGVFNLIQMMKAGTGDVAQDQILPQGDVGWKEIPFTGGLGESRLSRDIAPLHVHKDCAAGVMLSPPDRGKAQALVPLSGVDLPFFRKKGLKAAGPGFHNRAGARTRESVYSR